MLPCWNTRNQREQPRAAHRNAGSTSLDRAPCRAPRCGTRPSRGNSRAGRGPVRRRGRSAQREQPTSICGERGRGVLHPRRRRRVAAAPGADARHDAARGRAQQPSRRAAKRRDEQQRRSTVIQTERRERGRARGRASPVSGAQAATASLEDRGDQRAGRSRSGKQQATSTPIGAEHAPAATRARARRASDRAVPRKTAPKTLTKQATASAPIRASAGAAKAAAERRAVPRPDERAEQAEVDEELADEAVQRRQAADRDRADQEAERGPRHRLAPARPGGRSRACRSRG